MQNLDAAKILRPAIHRFLTLLSFSFAALAENPAGELVTDRPDQTESSVLVAPGYVQIETGVAFTDEGRESRGYEVMGTLIRAGLTKRLELRLGFGGWVRELEEPGNSGLADTELGLKLYLWEERGLRPEAALLGHVSLPSGEEGHSTERPDPSFRLAFSHTLSERVGLGYNIGVSWETTEELVRPAGLWALGQRRAESLVEDLIEGALDGRVPGSIRGRLADEANGYLFPERFDRDTQATLNYTATTGIGLTQRMGMFLELFGDVPLNAPGPPRHYADGGVTFLLRENVQLDIAGGAGLNAAAADWFIGAGISVRFSR